MIILFLLLSGGGLRAEVSSAISATEQRQREVMAQLFILNKNVREATRAAKALTLRRSLQESAARSLAGDVAELEAQIDLHRESFSSRARHLYRARMEGPLAQLFSAKSPIEFDRQTRFLRLLAEDDQNLLRRYHARREERATKRARLKNIVADLRRLEARARAQADQLEAKCRTQARLMGELERTREGHLAALKIWRSEHQEERAAFVERKGELAAPLAGKVAHEFGPYTDKKFRFRLMHHGRYYRAPLGEAVRAIYDGVIALATDIPGYGSTVIVDHGDNYYSVYAFSSLPKFKEGARVHEGEQLATTGFGSPLFGPGLYFELRHFTDAIDPRAWIKEP